MDVSIHPNGSIFIEKNIFRTRVIANIALQKALFQNCSTFQNKIGKRGGYNEKINEKRISLFLFLRTKSTPMYFYIVSSSSQQVQFSRWSSRFSFFCFLVFFNFRLVFYTRFFFMYIRNSAFLGVMDVDVDI